jgi:hypothetical protein
LAAAFIGCGWERRAAKHKKHERLTQTHHHPPRPAPRPAAFGLSLFAKSSNQARADLLLKGLPGLVGMLVGLAPTLGQYYKPEPDVGFGSSAGGGGSSASGSSGGSEGGNGVAAAAVAEPMAAASGK